jgi:hypothetical protein
MDFLQTILDEPVENDENTKETTFGPTPSHYCAFSRASGERVLDPKVIVPKPPSKKTMKPFHETLRESNGHKKRTRYCSECVANLTMTFANVLDWVN